jgi:glycosyltransferase involved in cell wall biosynthesis
MLRICDSLSQAGWGVTLVGRKRRNSKPLPRLPFKTKRLNCFFDRGKAFYAVLNLRLFWFMAFRKVDCICAVDLDTWLACRAACRVNGARLAYDAHELFPEVPEVIRRPGTRKIWKRIERKAATHSQIRYTVSQAIADYFRREYDSVFEVIRNVPLKATRPAMEAWHDSSAPVIIYQGALNEGRCLESLLHAMATVDCELELAGEGDLSAQLRALSEQLGLQRKVRFLGFVPPNELPAITAKATLGFNLLEQRGLSYYYSLGNKFFDYIHAGIPQICADFPEYRKLNDRYDVAVLTNDNRPESIATTVQGLLAGRERLKRLRLNCLAAREELNWENEQQRLLSIYDWK